MRTLTLSDVSAALLLAAAMLGGCAQETVHRCPEPIADTPPTEPAPVVMHPVEPSPMPGWARWMPADGFPGVERGGSFAAAGWATATIDERRAIAERFCRGLLDWDIVWDLDHTPWEASEAARFTPAAATVRDGAVVFTAWSDETFVGMRPPVSTEYRKFEAVFARDGRVTVRVIETYDAPRRRT